MSVNATLDDPELNKDGAPAGDDGDDGGDEGGGFDARKIVLFVLLPLFVLAGVGGGLYFTGTLDSILAPKEETGEERTVVRSKAAPTSAYFLEIPNMVVNLSSGDGQPRYLRLSVQLELGSTADIAAVEAVMPRVIDQFQTYLRELRVRDLRGSQGIYRLQMELLSRVNAAAYPVEVKDVLFQEILIQ